MKHQGRVGKVDVEHRARIGPGHRKRDLHVRRPLHAPEVVHKLERCAERNCHVRGLKFLHFTPVAICRAVRDSATDDNLGEFGPAQKPIENVRRLVNSLDHRAEVLCNPYVVRPVHHHDRTAPHDASELGHPLAGTIQVRHQSPPS